MHRPRQDYYSSLSGFRSHFKKGVPVLMYHKVGMRPPGTIFKALYMRPDFFSRQIAELRVAGFASAGMDDCLDAGDGAQKVVITFDDGFQNVMEHALKPLAVNGFRAIQFLVAGLLGKKNEWDLPHGEVQERLMDIAQVREWLAAGHEIGSHTMTHPHLDRIPPAEAREQIFASKKSLEDTFGVPIKHFCYPYGDWNQAVRDLVEEAGYLTACTAHPGINTRDTPRFEIQRWMARYAGLRPKEVLARVMDKVFA